MAPPWAMGTGRCLGFPGIPIQGNQGNTLNQTDLSLPSPAPGPPRPWTAVGPGDSGRWAVSKEFHAGVLPNTEKHAAVSIQEDLRGLLAWGIP